MLNENEFNGLIDKSQSKFDDICNDIENSCNRIINEINELKILLDILFFEIKIWIYKKSKTGDHIDNDE